MPPPPIIGAEGHYVFRWSVRPLSFNTYFALRDISVLSGGISIKLGI